MSSKDAVIPKRQNNAPHAKSRKSGLVNPMKGNKKASGKKSFSRSSGKLAGARPIPNY